MKDLAFDLDGVLIDALDIHRAAFIEAWRHCTKLTWLDEAFHDEHLASLSTKQKIEKLKRQNLMFEWDGEQICTLKQEITLKTIDTATITVPWLKELIASLKSDGRKIALVSNSIRATCLRTLSNNKLLELFDVIVGGGDVPLGKPNAQPYESAAAQLGVATNNLVAFEDSPPGLLAAKSAGCWPYVVSQPSFDLEETRVRAWLKIVDVV